MFRQVFTRMRNNSRKFSRFYSNNANNTGTQYNQNHTTKLVVAMSIGFYVCYQHTNYTATTSKLELMELELKNSRNYLESLNSINDIYAKIIDMQKESLEDMSLVDELFIGNAMGDMHVMVSDMQSKLYPDKKLFDYEWNPVIDREFEIVLNNELDSYEINCFGHNWNVSLDEERMILKLNDERMRHNYFLTIAANFEWNNTNTETETLVDPQDDNEQSSSSINTKQQKKEQTKTFMIYPNVPDIVVLPTDDNTNQPTSRPDRVTLKIHSTFWFPNEEMLNTSLESYKQIEEFRLKRIESIRKMKAVHVTKNKD
jgi:hypothetical protein